MREWLTDWQGWVSSLVFIVCLYLLTGWGLTDWQWWIMVGAGALTWTLGIDYGEKMARLSHGVSKRDGE